MINEKPNSNSDWINKLGEFEGLPGENFNKEVSWEKLHKRVYNRNQKARE